MSEVPTIKLNTGGQMPVIGFGTWRLQEGDETKQAVLEALKLGYRLVDTAALYANEESVGEAINESGLKREDVLITTKLPGWTPGYKETLEEFERSLTQLGTNYVDLYLIHSPSVGDREEVWRAMEEIYEFGKAKAVGVSNYAVKHMEELMSYSSVLPAVNQIEFHPFIYKNMKPILELCKDNGIVVEAYSPLARARDLNNTTLHAIAERHGKTIPQVMIRWAIQHGTIPIPKSKTPARIKENFKVFDFELAQEEMQTLNNLSNGDFIVSDPNERD